MTRGVHQPGELVRRIVSAQFPMLILLVQNQHPLVQKWSPQKQYPSNQRPLQNQKFERNNGFLWFSFFFFFCLKIKFIERMFCLSLLNFIYLFYLWLCWVFVSVRGLSPVVASGGHSSSQCTGLSPSRPLLLRSTGS